MYVSDEARRAFAQVMGMKSREILAVEEAFGGYVVTTHDHQRTFVDETGQVAGAAPPVPVPVAREPERVQSQEPSQEPSGGPSQEASGGPSQGAGGSAPAPDASPPDGSEKDVLGWVDGDPDRAAAALRAEEARETPRKGLLGKLQQQLAG